jgi:hypothetical protein
LTEGKFNVVIKATQIRKGFIRIPGQQAREFFPTTRTTIAVLFDDSTKAKNVTYSPQNNRIYGVTEWLKQHARGQAAEVEVVERNRVYRIRRIGGPIEPALTGVKTFYGLMKKPLEMGFIPVPKHLKSLFPQTHDTMRLPVIFDDTGERVELTYNGHYRRLFGLTAWYRKNNAQPGDLIHITTERDDPFVASRYRLRFEARQTKLLPTISPEITAKVGLPIKPQRTAGRYVGEPLKFRGLMYEPVNENGVIFVFALVAQDLGFFVEGIQEAFPDAFGRKRENSRLSPVDIEFKFKSSGYKQYYREGRICDLIVCWEHDWKECPIEVLELRSKIKELES